MAADDRLHEKGGNVHSGHPALHPVVRPGGRHHRRPAGDVPEPAGGAAPPDRGMQHTLETVEYKCWFYETAREAGTVQAPKSMTEQEIPERFRTIRRELKGE